MMGKIMAWKFIYDRKKKYNYLEFPLEKKKIIINK